MKISVTGVIICLMMICCTKSDNSNILSGKWMQLSSVERFINPISQNVEYDTLSVPAVTVEFRNDGSYFVNGVQSGSYTLSHDTSFVLNPYASEYHITISNDQLQTRRAGVLGEQVKIPDPNIIGFYHYANVQYVYTYYKKQ